MFFFFFFEDSIENRASGSIPQVIDGTSEVATQVNYSKYLTLALNRVVRVALTCFENKNLTVEQKKLVKLFLKSNLSDILKNSKLNLHKKLKVLNFIYLK